MALKIFEKCDREKSGELDEGDFDHAICLLFEGLEVFFKK